MVIEVEERREESITALEFIELWKEYGSIITNEIRRIVKRNLSAKFIRSTFYCAVRDDGVSNDVAKVAVVLLKSTHCVKCRVCDLLAEIIEQAKVCSKFVYLNKEV